MRNAKQSLWNVVLSISILLAVQAAGQSGQSGSQGAPQKDNDRQVLNRGKSDVERISREVRHELVMLPYSVFDNLEYQVNGDTVVLTGQVVNTTLKDDAQARVRKIEGVERVENKIEVLPTSINDDRLRRQLFRAIYGHEALSKYSWEAVPPIHIIVKNGQVTLAGVVLNDMDKQIAEVQANSVGGVFKVTNNLRVEKS